MRVLNSPKSVQTLIPRLKGQKKRIGFVPTMGALHEGHLSLLRKARRENDIVILSIYVNPKQFSPKEDFSVYPRPFKKDEKLAKKEKVDIIFYPSDKHMYPRSFLTNVHVNELADRLCGKTRAGHFDGVATVVAKLLNIVSPDTLYLGQKDAQQAIIIQRMVEDLNLPVRVCVCPTVREKDGLAMSSRNQYLTVSQRREAPHIYKALFEAKRRILKKERSASHVVRQIKRDITRNTSGRIEYVSCVDAKTLQPVKTLKGNILIALAVRLKTTRLIDNITVKVR